MKSWFLGVLTLAAIVVGHPPPSLPLIVEFAGCASVWAGPVCELSPDRTLRLWVTAPKQATVWVTAGGSSQPLAGTEVQGGVLMRLQVADNANAVTVKARIRDVRSTFRLPILPPTIVPELDQAEALRQSGQFDKANALLETLLIDGRPAVQAQAKRKLARIARVQGQPDRAVAMLTETISLAHREGRISDEFNDRFTLAFIQMHVQGRPQDARHGLDQLIPLEPIHPEGRAVVSYFRGMIAALAGDVRATLHFARQASIRTERLGGVGDYQLQALQLQADALGILGRHTEASALMRQAEATLSSADHCLRSRLLNNAGWQTLRAAESAGLEEQPLVDALPLLEKARQLSGQGCADPLDQENLLVNLALAELQRRNTVNARGYLAQLRNNVQGRRDQAALRPEVIVWWLILEGRIALAEGQPQQALTWFQALANLGETGLFPEASVTAALGRAQALDTLEQVADADAAYDLAQTALDQWSLLVPIGAGRDTFLAQYEQVARLHVDFLVRHAAPQRAVKIARKNRSRLLRTLAWTDRISAMKPDTRARWEAARLEYTKARRALDNKVAQDWRLPEDLQNPMIAARTKEYDALRSALDKALAELDSGSADGADHLPDDGELLLVVHPLRQGWVGFAVTKSQIVIRILGELDLRSTAPDLADELLVPFHDVLERAQKVRFEAYGALDHIDLHALPWQGQPLLARMPVTYGMNLLAHDATLSGSPQLAVVVGDPRGDLSAARTEAAQVAGLLSQAGWRVQRMDRDEATHDAVRSALEQPGLALFHYAGHGVFQGLDGWESGLPLAAEGWLTVGDVLALQHSPLSVVLSGCNTARTADDARAAGLGLAQAFLAAGANAVVAATRPVHDALAARIVTSLYHHAAGNSDDIAAALQAAQRESSTISPKDDWASFRVLVR